MFLENRPDAIKQDRLRQKCSKDISWKPHKKVLGTLFGRANCRHARTLRHCLTVRARWGNREALPRPALRAQGGRQLAGRAGGAAPSC
eukprot:6067503-Pyramimonas_sp.AAC.1